MAQDLRELFEKERKAHKFRLPEDHEARFMERLEKEMPKARSRWSPYYLSGIAATLALLLALGGTFLRTRERKAGQDAPGTDLPSAAPGSLSLGDLSPDLRRVEDYYMASINLELAQLEVSDATKGVVDGFMDRLSELNAEYQRLNRELNQMGPNDQTITALIKNLQLRLQLLHKLREKLNRLKTAKNETHNTL